MTNRDILRHTILQQRDQLPAPQRAEASAIIGQRLWEFPPFQQSHSLLFYVNFRSEVETIKLMARCLRAGHKVAAPRTITKDRRLIAYAIEDLDNDLRPGYCNILEPHPSRCLEVEPTTIDLVIVPGSVFDPQGGRLGYGGGYYDRFFSNQAPQATRVALAYEMQVIPQVPTQSHDMPMHYLLTEKQLRTSNPAHPKPNTPTKP